MRDEEEWGVVVTGGRIGRRHGDGRCIMSRFVSL